ncbi:hypothetical protein RIF29_08279 [Crotalaria pallida]|uniref:Uncharacterized protein n=1 Tax=Crotalaria pallida TaxID=3830 RepID=A0AAN9J702_CROPI
MSTRKTEEHEGLLHLDSDSDDKETTCRGFIGFKRNQVFDYYYYYYSSVGEEEEEEEEELFEINLKEKEKEKEEPLLGLDKIAESSESESESESTVFSLDVHNLKDDDDDVVYVAVGNHNGESSMQALSWALKHSVTPSTTTLHLIHVFPPLNLIPTPLGKIPRSHIHPEYVNMYLTQERGKRKLLLQKFIHLCIDSKVKVETMLIEGDNVAKAIVDIVENLNIRKLVIGTSKANLRKSERGKRNGIPDMVVKNAQESCDVKIICEGQEVMDHYLMIRYTTTTTTATSSSFTDGSTSSSSRATSHEEDDYSPVGKRKRPLLVCNTNRNSTWMWLWLRGERERGYRRILFNNKKEQKKTATSLTHKAKQRKERRMMEEMK